MTTNINFCNFFKNQQLFDFWFMFSYTVIMNKSMNHTSHPDIYKKTNEIITRKGDLFEYVSSLRENKNFFQIITYISYFSIEDAIVMANFDVSMIKKLLSNTELQSLYPIIQSIIQEYDTTIPWNPSA